MLLQPSLRRERQDRENRKQTDRHIRMTAELLTDTVPTEEEQGQNKNLACRYSQSQLLFDIHSLSCILKNQINNRGIAVSEREKDRKRHRLFL